MTSKVRVFCGWLSTGTRRDEQHFTLRKLEAQYGDRIEFIWPERAVARMWHDFARNATVEEFLQTDADILWFLDSDVVPPSNVLDLLTEHGEKWEIAGAPYAVYMRAPGYKTNQVVFCVYNRRFPEKDILDPAPIPDTGTGFVDGIATGCLFIKRSVLASMTKPYFEHEFNKETRELSQGEDIGFCKKMMERKIQFFIDYSMRCNHFKHVDLLSLSDTIEEQKRMAIEAYSKMFRSQITRQKLAAMREKPKSNLILPK